MSQLTVLQVSSASSFLKNSTDFLKPGATEFLERHGEKLFRKYSLLSALSLFTQWLRVQLPFALRKLSEFHFSS
jgi:hypothetical protein